MIFPNTFFSKLEKRNSTCDKIKQLIRFLSHDNIDLIDPYTHQKIKTKTYMEKNTT